MLNCDVCNASSAIDGKNILSFIIIVVIIINIIQHTLIKTIKYSSQFKYWQPWQGLTGWLINVTNNVIQRNEIINVPYLPRPSIWRKTQPWAILERRGFWNNNHFLASLKTVLVKKNKQMLNIWVLQTENCILSIMTYSLLSNEKQLHFNLSTE